MGERSILPAPNRDVDFQLNSAISTRQGRLHLKDSIMVAPVLGHLLAL